MIFQTQSVMQLSAVYFLCFVATALASEFLPAEDAPAPTALRMMGQETMPYTFKRGEITRAEVDFVPGVYCNELKMRIRVKLTSNWFDYPLEEKNVCDDLIKGKCPLKPGDKATFRMEMPVHKKYPKLNLRVEIKLLNEFDEPVCGFQITGKTMD